MRYDWQKSIRKISECTEKRTIKIDDIITSTSINLKKFLNNQDYVKLKEGVYPIKILIAAISSSKNKNIALKVNNFNSKENFPWA